MLPVNFPNSRTIIHAWARNKFTITWKDEDGNRLERRVVDYKLDNSGVGVYFIVGQGARGINSKYERDWVEVYKVVPVRYRPNTRVPEDSHNIDGHTGKFAKLQREMKEQEEREERVGEIWR